MMTRKEQVGMKRSNWKKTILIALSVLTGAFCLSGCAPGTGTTLATVGSEKVPYGVANFYVRYVQASYENYYSYMGTNTSTMWSQTGTSTTGSTMEAELKSNMKDTITTLYVLDQNKADYNVSITDEQTNIDNAADSFISANDEKTLKVMTADKDTIVHFLELVTIQQKMYNAMTADTDTNVTDEEAAQKKMSYVKFSYADTSTSSGSTDTSSLTSDELKAQAQSQAAAFRAGVLSETDFDAYATAQGLTGKDVTFDSTGTSPNADVVDALEEGGTTDIIDSTDDSAFYVARLVSALDADATATQKQSIISQRKTDNYNTKYDAMKSAITITWNDKVWDKLSLVKQGVTVKQSSTDTSSSSSSSAASSQTLSTDTSLTVANGDKVNIDYSGTIDGVAFDGGTASGADLTIGSGQFISGFEDQLIGHNVGETVAVNVTFPSDYSEASLQGKAAVFTVKINGIYQ